MYGLLIIERIILDGEGTLETETKFIDTMKQQKGNTCAEVITSTDLIVARHSSQSGSNPTTKPL